MSAPFRLYNTLHREVEPFIPHRPGRVSLYVCGMTVYADAHVGHARAMVVFDTVSRYLRHRGWDVNFIRNYTDVDDKIIAAAKDTGEDPAAFAERFITRFREDVAHLGLLPPTSEPRVTESIDDIVAIIQKLVDAGNAYAADGSVWFSVASCPDYGKLSGQKVDEMRSGDAEGGKRAPQDFALWKAAKAGEPAWPSPWGEGRPGWHIECSAMVLKQAGLELDIHGGGLDLVFPHHENEIAQSECANGHVPYARYWMHNGLLVMDSGEKMGKSKGNAFTIRAALERFPSEAMRLYYLQVHYRSPLPWDVEALPEALALLARLYEARDAALAMEGDGKLDEMLKELGADARTAYELAEKFPARFYEAMDDDFNSARALGYAFELARAVNRLSNHKKAKKKGGPIARKALEAFAVVTDAIGLLAHDSEAFHDEVKRKRLATMGLERADIDQAIVDRRKAREEKRWADADAIRDDLDRKGIVVMDNPEGTVWRVRIEASEAEKNAAS
jgi:cysteinyl-tRNA synthetase